MGVEVVVRGVGRLVNWNRGHYAVCGLRGAAFVWELMQRGMAVSGLIPGAGKAGCVVSGGCVQ